ncbi:E3 ubiquitin-protein ligase RNF115 [Salmo trutta]|uniref:RING-type E3 ubiquitin transferase n=1 Tax=Salmo trutta TaxID=8032 RepID=A0A674CLZ5_SALTR|nr:E3 ubiquitin-protein ligase RNF115-like [Salmo trutta]|eukprot:XP_014032393.1 PREDICTED: E3 ubiquitin-protein ligase RNF115-like [Salmo salar]
MAEAAAAPQNRFFCHCCKGEIDPKLPEFTCPRCESDFIEEVTEDSSLLENSSTAEANDDTGTLFSELWQLLFMERSALLLDPSTSESESDQSHLQAAAVEEEVEGPSEVPVASVGGTDPLVPEPERPSRPPSQGRRQSHTPAVEGIVQQFLAGLFANNGNPGIAPAALSGMLHSNPGDYAWGQGGLDAVITELLGQFEGTGPPPAEKEMISSLPTVNVSQEQTDSRLECPVCREEYSMGESVKQLPCLHYFHSDCIVPWLELHDTCPVCRKSLDGVDQSIQPPPEPPEPLSIRTDPQEERQAI